MKSEVVFKKTCELSKGDREQILELFHRVFDRRMCPERFHHKYLSTPFGYSYHGLLTVNGHIEGSYNVIPYLYKFYGKETTFGMAVDLMVAKEYRAPFTVANMARLVYRALAEDGIEFVFGFPTDLVYELKKKMLRWKDIGVLNYYILPRNIGMVVPKLRFFNYLSRSLAAVMVRLPTFQSISNTRFDVEKVCCETFEKNRYDDRHRCLRIGDSKCFYRTCDKENGTRVLYIMDVCPLEPHFFRRAVRTLYHEYAKSIDIFVYEGRLPFLPWPLVTVPHFFTRQRQIRMIGRLLESKNVDARVFDINNWNVNISTFDVL